MYTYTYEHCSYKKKTECGKHVYTSDSLPKERERERKRNATKNEWY